jgi:5'-nucleotidase
VLVTNDDGVDAPALAVLAAQLHDAGHDVQVAAPLVEHTGCGASLGPIREGLLIEAKATQLDGCSDVPAVAVDAPPALAVLAAFQGRFGPPPDVVVSGTNSGFNTGPAVLHSGTVGAALTAAAQGVAGVALSTERNARHGFVTAARFCALALPDLVYLAGERSALSINVPDLPFADLAGVRATGLGEASLVSIAVTHDGDGLRLHRVRGGNTGAAGGDVAAVRAGHVSVTRLLGGLKHLPVDVSALDRLTRGGAR